MNKSPLDTLIDRRNTSSIKWQKFEPDVIPMWVADMEFATPDVVTEALHERISHPIFGYTATPESLVSTVSDYCSTRHHWEINTDCLTWVPGVLPALTAACQIAGRQGDEIIAFPPVYHPLLEIPEKIGKTRVDVPMLYIDNQWHIDFDLLEQSITAKTVAILLSSPHNPMGIIFSAEQLLKLASLCAHNNLLLISDEIHCDLILHHNKHHIPTALAAGEHHASVITIMSPSKTFNLAGANCSFVHITHPDWLDKFRAECHYTIPLVPTLSYTAAEAAYSKGWQWHAQLIEYLRANHDYLLTEINQIDGLSMDPVEATYLAWINTSDPGIPDAFEFFKRAGIGFSPGSQFGDDRYQRLNFACSRAQLSEAVERIRHAVEKHFS